MIRRLPSSYLTYPLIPYTTLVRSPNLSPQAFGIERPAFDIGGVAAETQEIGQLIIFLREADLEMMPRHGFVQIERFHARRGARRQVVAVVIEYARPRSVGPAGHVIGPGRCLFDIGRHRPDRQRAV